MITREEARRLRAIIEKQMQGADDVTALEAVTLYPHWRPNMEYVTGYRLQHNGVLYSVLQDHISQETWTPDVSPSLFAKVLIPDPNVNPEWEQPDSTNPYMMGDKVKHNGKVWISDVDGNVWEPGVYGWSEVPEGE